jgi:hypothetical protein
MEHVGIQYSVLTTLRIGSGMRSVLSTCGFFQDTRTGVSERQSVPLTVI